MSSCWLYDLLETHLSEVQLDQVESFIHAESWASPAARLRNWNENEDPPLRFRLDIDVET
jgi:hypothetical protein